MLITPPPRHFFADAAAFRALFFAAARYDVDADSYMLRHMPAMPVRQRRCHARVYVDYAALIRQRMPPYRLIYERANTRLRSVCRRHHHDASLLMPPSCRITTMPRCHAFV